MKNLISRILVAVDGSIESMAAATQAITMARIYNAELFTLTIINTQPWFHSSTLYGWADDQTIEKVYAKDRNESQLWADQIIDNAKVNGVKVSTKILMVPTTSSSVPASIVNYVEQNNIDIIVMGTRGRSGFKKMLLGSTAVGVLTYAPCPVMIVK
ncbi:MAG TPA: universal stress protein [Nitrososphaeraceae archaeon]|jgi:nucleotide-binding universal stress UspA family protein